jgi:flavin reductase (DIM6/NTAB) family NADH-FMN oxidoreductase RutF
MITKRFLSEEFALMEKRYRAAMINSICGFKSVALVGTVDKNGQTNLAIFNSIFHLGANPALCGLIVRPDSVARHTLENIIETGYYTINHLNKNIFKQAHQTSARYPKTISEFESVDLQTEYSDVLIAPYVKESHLKFGLHLKEKIAIEINDTILLIGEIIELFVPENCIANDGFVDLELAETITCSGLDSYHTTQKIARLPYAKP